MISINSSLIHNKIAGLGKELKSGDFVFLKVISGEGKDYQVSIKGVLIPVKSDLKLAVGSILKALIIKEGEKFSFRLVADGDLPLNVPVKEPGVFEAISTPEEGLDRLARGLIRSGLPLNPEIIRSIPISIRKQAEKDDFLSRLVGILLKKGLSPDEITIDSILSGIFGDGFDSDKRQDSGKQDRHGGPGRGADSDKQPDDESDNRITSAELKSLWNLRVCF